MKEGHESKGGNGERLLDWPGGSGSCHSAIGWEFDSNQTQTAIIYIYVCMYIFITFVSSTMTTNFADAASTIYIVYIFTSKQFEPSASFPSY